MNHRLVRAAMPFFLGAQALLVSHTALALDGQRWDEGIGYFVGIDTLSTVASGTFAGLANPNAGRLTWLFDHGDHFHSIGAYSYTGTASAPVVNTTNANNRIPELYTRTNDSNNAIPLMQGSGLFSGSWASGVLPASTATHDYSHLGVASIQSLDNVDAGSEVLFHSSNNRWNASFQGVTVGLQLLSSTPGLKVAVGNALDVFGAGSVYALGSSVSFAAAPVFYLDGSAADGIYSAQFQLVNLGSNPNVRQSGTFSYDFRVAQPIPEPSTWLTLVAGLMAITALTSRRRRQS